MKIFSTGQRKPPRQYSPVKCLLVNQLATPGLGSLMARRFIAGTVELLLSLLGFGLFMVWLFEILAQFYHQMGDLPPGQPPDPRMGKAGLILFGAAWGLSWITSIRILREARRNEMARPPGVPPKIT